MRTYIKALEEAITDQHSRGNELTIGTKISLNGVQLIVTQVDRIGQDFLREDIREIAMDCVGEMVKEQIIPDCTDTNNNTEWEVQDIIFNRICAFLQTPQEDFITADTRRSNGK